MAFIDESMCCSQTEYEAGVQERLYEDELQEETVYRLMARLSCPEHYAAAIPVRIARVAEEAGASIVQLAFLDNDYFMMYESDEEIIENGIIHFNDLEVQGPSESHQHIAGQSYLLEREEEWDEDLDLLFARKSLTK